MQGFLATEEETKEVAKEFAKNLTPGSVVCLDGNLGAGKTTFVKGIASHFGIAEEEVTSPTFIYLHLYDTIAHFDLYRLKGENEFLSLGFDEYLEKPFISLIEWPNILQSVLPAEYVWISLEHHEGGRFIEIETRGGVHV